MFQVLYNLIENFWQIQFENSDNFDFSIVSLRLLTFFWKKLLTLFFAVLFKFSQVGFGGTTVN